VGEEIGGLSERCGSVVCKSFGEPGLAFGIQSGELRDGDRLLITGETTGAVEFTANGVREEDAPTGHARKGTLATLATPERVRANDKVYVLTLRKFGYPPEE